MEISYHSWILVGLFALNLLFMLIMTIVSPFYKHILSSGWGMALNIIWMVLIITLTGTYLFFNVSCLMSDEKCTALSWTTIGVVGVLTLWIIINSLVLNYKYNKQNKKEPRKPPSSEYWLLD